MQKKTKTQITILFLCRLFLWIVALGSTVYWVRYSVQLHENGIFDPHEYATALRPVLYTCLIISVAAVCISFVLYARSAKLKSSTRAPDLVRDTDLAPKSRPSSIRSS